LSFPEVSADITRATRVTVQATDLEGKPIEFEAEGLLSRAAQHETDHLNGILFIDRMSSAAKVSLGSKLKRLQQEKSRESFVPKGQEDSARGFNPGNRVRSSRPEGAQD